MSYYFTAIKTEWLKKRRTGTFLISFILGIFLPLAYFLVSIFRTEDEGIPGMPYNYYENLSIMFMDGFGYFFLPLLIIITAAKITHTDHKNRGWDLMETQPLTKFSIYFSKLSILIISNLISILSFLAGTILIGLVLSNFQTVNINATLEIPWKFFFLLGFRLFVASLFLSALQLLLSIWFTNFIVPILIGFFAMVGTIILSNMNNEYSWNPFTILKQTTEYPEGSLVGNTLLYTEKISLIGFVLFTVVGFIYYKNKNFKRIIRQPKNLVLISLVCIFGIGSIYWINQTTYSENYHKTILAGSLQTDQKINELLLIDSFLEDTIVSIPIKNNHFHYEIQKDLPLDEYSLFFAGSNPIIYNKLIFGQGDSLFIKAESYNGKHKMTGITGTRLAENRFSSGHDNLGFARYVAHSEHYLETPQQAISSIYSYWKEDYKKAISFRTRDNYGPRKDFGERARKLTTVNYLNLWNEYLDKLKIIRPEFADQTPEKIQEMKNKVSLHDNDLISQEAYLDYVLYELTSKDLTDTDFITKNLKAVEQLPEGDFKDRLLFSILKEALGDAANADEREELYQLYSKSIQNRYLRQIAFDYYQTQNNLASGALAPDFTAKDLEGNPIHLSDFRGKKLVLDVWATWCGPCLYQAPYFERVAIRNKNSEDILFIALSVDSDADKQKWLLQAKGKTESVLQWRISENDQEKFKKQYGITGIPHYIFIDENGAFIDANMVFPKNTKFEEAIQKELAKDKIVGLK